MVELLENKLDDILAKDDEENEGKWYYLDFFPVTFQAGNDKFDEFESFIQEKYYKSFSKKLSFIILGLVSYYDAEIYLYDVDYGDDWLNSLRHQDLLSQLEYQDLSKLIKHFCVNETLGLKIALQDYDNLALMLFEGGLRLSFYNLTDEQKKVAEDLTRSQGFFFKESIADL